MELSHLLDVLARVLLDDRPVVGRLLVPVRVHDDLEDVVAARIEQHRAHGGCEALGLYRDLVVLGLGIGDGLAPAVGHGVRLSLAERDGEHRGLVGAGERDAALVRVDRVLRRVEYGDGARIAAVHGFNRNLGDSLLPRGGGVLHVRVDRASGGGLAQLLALVRHDGGTRRKRGLVGLPCQDGMAGHRAVLERRPERRSQGEHLVSGLGKGRLAGLHASAYSVFAAAYHVEHVAQVGV